MTKRIHPRLEFKFEIRGVERRVVCKRCGPERRWIISRSEKLDSFGYGSDTQVQCHLDAELIRYRGRGSVEKDSQI